MAVIIENKCNYISFNMTKTHEFLDTYEIDPIFDYGSFLDNSISPDCTIILPSGKKIPAHRLILSRFSSFLYNAFTSGMQEDSQREVAINFDPGDQFINILHFMYTQQIDIDDQNILQLIEITHFYGLHELNNFLVNDHLKQILSPSNIFQYVDKCFDMELNESLRYLEPHLARFYQEIPIQIFSEKLDINTFCHVLTIAIKTKSFTDDVVAELNTFMSGAIPDENQKETLNSLVCTYGGNSTQIPCW